MTTSNARFEEFPIRDQNGVAWRAFRERLAPGIYRMPDDPSSSRDQSTEHINTECEPDMPDLRADESKKSPKRR